MDLRMIDNDYRFSFRVSAVIYNNDLSKILLFNVSGRDVFLLPGGKVQMYESSLEAIKREILEELGFYMDFTLIGISEEFKFVRKYNNHQLNLIYKGVYTGDVKSGVFIGLEGDWANYRWVSVSDINNYNIHPDEVKKIVNGKKKFYHFVMEKDYAEKELL